MEQVWYAGYGSNLDPVRFRCYLEGGRPPGARRTYPGTRDGRPARAQVPYRLRGSLVFAGVSTAWGGGLALLDHRGDEVVLCRAYLLTRRELVDVLEQEMRREPGSDHDLAPALAPDAEGSCHVVGPGRYETVHRVGELGGHPVVTLGCDDVRAHAPRPPAPAYLATIARGLRVTHGLSVADVVDYLARCRGIAGHLTRAELRDLL
ncbi:histone deacetylase [Nocardioides sp. GCM10027113]|uniref:histone deacetylase n=1 Tax=unclassified Nocardioides TaxID=2615069 RepID=UPI00361E0A31